MASTAAPMSTRGTFCERIAPNTRRRPVPTRSMDEGYRLGGRVNIQTAPPRVPPEMFRNRDRMVKVMVIIVSASMILALILPFLALLGR